MDRASGSGVFARDPDALLDLIELDITDDLRRNEENKAVCSVCLKWLQRFGKDGEVSQDDRCNQNALSDACRQLLPPQSYKLMMQEVNGEKQCVGSFTAWRVEGTLREFPKFPTVNLWFKYPVHTADETGCLKDIEPDGEKPVYRKKAKVLEESKRDASKEESLCIAFSASDMESSGKVRLSDLSEYMGVSLNTLKKYVDKSKHFKRENGVVIRTDDNRG